VLFEGMSKREREVYAKNLLVRQQAARMSARTTDLRQEDPTLLRRRVTSGSVPAPGGATTASLPSASRGPRPTPLRRGSSASDGGRSGGGGGGGGDDDVATSFVVAETGVSRGGSALSYGTTPPASVASQFSFKSGGRTYATAALEEPELVVPPRPLPFPVLWQLHSHPSEQVSLPALATPLV
jgi:hypothetical protein